MPADIPAGTGTVRRHLIGRLAMPAHPAIGGSSADTGHVLRVVRGLRTRTGIILHPFTIPLAVVSTRGSLADIGMSRRPG
jgi:hypothetical protein